MIIVRAPFRTSFVGGGTDLPSHYEVHGGAVLSMSINRHVYMTGRKMFYPTQTLLKYSQSELVSHINEVKHPIFRTALEWMEVSGVDIGVTSDVPAGTGLGSSSTFTVALLSLLGEIKGHQLSKKEIAEMACELEIDRLGETIGKQDQFASAFGGMNLFRFDPNGHVDVVPVGLSAKEIAWLNESCWLVKIPGEARSASAVLAETQKFVEEDASAKLGLQKLATLAFEAHESVLSEGIWALPQFVREAWELKKLSSPAVSMSMAHEVISRGMTSGALAGKLLGAGGGGFAFFFVNSEKEQAFLRAFRDLKVMRIRPEFDGVHTVLREEEE